jgi:hypothetical protein
MRNPFLQEEKQIMRRDRRTDAGYQRAVGELVEREVIYGVSGIVFEIGTEKTDDWFHLFVQEDWETAAREAIPQLPPEKLLEFLERNDCPVSPDATPAFCLTYLETDGSWQEFCAANDLEPHRNEIYEHWIVSNWLADQLEKRGEVIERDFYGLTIWGRACTGQAILLDDVICSIYDELHKPERPQQIAELNDRFRSRCGMPVFGEHVPGGFVFTQGINSLPPETQVSIWLPCAISATSPKATTRMQSAISEPSRLTACRKRFSGRFLITPMPPAPAARKTLPIPPGAFAS